MAKKNKAKRAAENQQLDVEFAEENTANRAAAARNPQANQKAKK